MARPSPSYTVALHLSVPASQKAVTTLVDTASSVGAIVNGIDVSDSDGDRLVTDGTAVLGLGDIGPEAAMPVMVCLLGFA